MGTWLAPQVLYAGFAGVVLLVLVYGNATDGDVRAYILDVVAAPCDVHDLRAVDRVAYRPLTISGLERVMLRILPHSNANVPVEWSGVERRTTLSFCGGIDANAVVTMPWTQSSKFQWPAHVGKPIERGQLANVAYDRCLQPASHVSRIGSDAFCRLSSLSFCVGRFGAPFTLDSILVQVHTVVGDGAIASGELPVLLPDMEEGVVDVECAPLTHDEIAASAMRYAVELKIAELREALGMVLLHSAPHLACRRLSTDSSSGRVDSLLILAKLGVHASDAGRVIIEQVLQS
jgi:hypothetical protein